MRNFIDIINEYHEWEEWDSYEHKDIKTPSFPDPTTNPNFVRWFGKSIVVDHKTKKPLVVFRGEHGDTNGNFLSRRSSLTFSSFHSANSYSLSPNDRDDLYASNPHVFPCYLKIEKPFIVQYTDPYVEFSDMLRIAPLTKVIELAIRFEDGIYNTGNWMDNYSDDYDSVEELLTQKPEEIKKLYTLAFEILDDAECVSLIKQAGYDGAIHGGFGVEHDAEYRVFDIRHVKSIFNNGSFNPSSTNISEQQKGGD